MSTTIGPQAYCQSCFDGWRLQIDPYRYDQTAMCPLGTDWARLDSQIQFFAPSLPPSGSVLEIGCATGELARSARAQFQTSRYEAIELSPAADVAWAHVDRLHEAPLPNLLAAGTIEGAFDLVLMSHVVEHFEAPWDELDAIVHVMAPEGTLFLEVPNASGNRGLPIVRSLSHLLAAKGLDTIATLTDARYADSIRLMARRFRPPQWSTTLISDKDLMQAAGPIIVWGAGSLADEILAIYSDPERIDFFIDRDPTKQVCPPFRIGRCPSASSSEARNSSIPQEFHNGPLRRHLRSPLDPNRRKRRSRRDNRWRLERWNVLDLSHFAA